MFTKLRGQVQCFGTLKIFDKNAPIANTEPTLLQLKFSNTYGWLRMFTGPRLKIIMYSYGAALPPCGSGGVCGLSMWFDPSPYQKCLLFWWVWFDDAFLRLSDFNGAQVLMQKQLSLDLFTIFFLGNADSSHLQILPVCQMRWSASKEFCSAWLIDSYETPEYHIEAFEMRLRYVYTAAMKKPLL